MSKDAGQMQSKTDRRALPLLAPCPCFPPSRPHIPPFAPPPPPAALATQRPPNLFLFQWTTCRSVKVQGSPVPGRRQHNTVIPHRRWSSLPEGAIWGCWWPICSPNRMWSSWIARKVRALCLAKGPRGGGGGCCPSPVRTCVAGGGRLEERFGGALDVIRRTRFAEPEGGRGSGWELELAVDARLSMTAVGWPVNRR